MRHYLIIILFTFCITSCGARDPQTLGDVEYKTATGATATVDVVAADKLLLSLLPAHSSVLRAAISNLHTSLQTEAVAQEDPAKLGKPLITAEALADDPEQAAITAAEEAEKRNEATIKEQEEGFWANLLNWGGWGMVGGLGLLVARFFNIPGVNLLTDPLVRKIGRRWIEPLEQHAQDAEETIQHYAATVEGSMAGRAGLAYLDKLLGDELAPKIKEITKGKADSVEGLFKWLSKAHVLDHKEHDSNVVGEIVDEIKDQMETIDGIPSSIKNLLGGFLDKYDSKE